MTVKDFEKYQTLSQICDNSFGKNGTVRGGTESVILKPANENTINAKFIMVVNFGSDNQMKHLMPRYKNEGVSLINAALKKVAEEYKEKTGKKITLKPNMDSFQDSVEFLSFQIYNPKRTAYYRLTCVIDVK